jgi:hypothetical protein
MLLTTHALIGAAIGKNINNPWLIVPISLVSHYVLDMFRHGDYIDKKLNLKGNGWKVSLDLFSAFLAVFLVIYFKNFSQTEIKKILLGVLFSLIPDSFTFLYWKFKLKILKSLYEFHVWIHEYFHPDEIEFSLKNSFNDILFSAIAIIIFLI